VTDRSTIRRRHARVWRFLRGATAVAAGMAIMNLGSYGLTVLAARSVAPADFGALTGLLGLIQIGFVASYGIQAAGARRLSTAGADRAGAHAELRRAGRLSAVALTAVSLVVTPLVMTVLHIDSVLAVLLMAPTLGLLTLMGAQAGALQGDRRWSHLAGLYASLGVGRLAGGVVGLVVRPDLVGVMAGIAVGAAVPVLLGGRLLRRDERRTAPGTPVRGLLLDAARGTHALLALATLANADVLLARGVLDGDDSGPYAVGSVVAKACMLLPQFVVVVLFPSLAAGGSGRRRLAGAVAATTGLGLCAVAATWLLADPAVSVIGGEGYTAITPLLWLFACAGSAYAVLQLIVYAAIARGIRHVASVIWLGLAVLVGMVLTLTGDGGLSRTTVVILGVTTGCALCIAAILASASVRPAGAGHRFRG
jgi:O-antigen/teichoic acid export membrane protein